MSNSLNGDADEGSSSLDHALLESLFYNEMGLMDDFSDSFLSGGGFMSIPSPLTTSSGDVSVGSSTQQTIAPLVAHADPAVTVEKDLLRDFGVVHSAGIAPPLAASRHPPPVPTPSTAPFIPPPIDKAQQQRILQLASGRGIRHNVAVPPAPFQQRPLAAAVQPPQPPSATDEDKRKKLVTQFATLAGRLGITLPPQVLQKLTNKAVAGTSAPLSAAVAVAPTVGIQPQATMPMVASVPSSMAPVPAPVIQQLQSTAAEAIAAVSNKRPAAVDDSKPYSKRRKKPRLSDCERKLAELQAENALLKSHLNNISNQNHKLDQERVKAETQMRAMLQENAPDVRLDPVVQNFTEMYSDYGRKRHEELNFHLEQLQRCVILTASEFIVVVDV
jgi:hypothetical protein